MNASALANLNLLEMKTEDKDDDLVILSHSYPSNIEMTKLLDGEERKLQISELCKRGEIYDRRTGEFKCPSTTFPIEICQFTPDGEDVSKIFVNTQEIINDSDGFILYEGTILRLFYYNKWYLATNKKLDAGQSRWSSKRSFREFFEEELQKRGYTFESLTDGLSKKNCYIFQITTSLEDKNIRTVLSRERKLFHLGTMVNFSENITFDDKIDRIDKPLRYKTENIHKIFQDVYNIYDDLRAIGVVFYSKSSPLQLKVMNYVYMYITSKIDNIPNIMKCYAQCYIRGDKKAIEVISTLHDYKLQDFQTLEVKIVELLKRICKAYIKRYMPKQFTKEDQLIHAVIVKMNLYVKNILQRKVQRNELYEIAKKVINVEKLHIPYSYTQ